MFGSPEIVRAIRRGLDDLKICAAESSTVWTWAVKTELCRIGRDEFRCQVGARDVEHRDYGEFLYDVTWLEYDGDLVSDAHLVAECEWGGEEEIDDDFQKLLLARATVRLMIFDGTFERGSPGIADHLARQAGRFNRSRDEDAWLLAAWERSEERDVGWRFRYFSIEKGAAREIRTA